MIRPVGSIILFIFPLCLTAQDTTTLQTPAGTQKILRIHYRNDLYTHTDYYFTQGEHVEYIHPAFNTFFLRKILIGQNKNSFQHSGFSFYGGGYTPTRLDTAGPLPDDRPFASYLYFGYFRETASPEKNILIKSEIALGCIGPPALGKETQVFLHRTLGSPTPLGWDHQVHTDLVVQYALELDQVLFSIRKTPVLWWEAKLHAGTMRDNISIGIKLDGQPIQHIFEKQQRKFFFSPFAGISITAVGYDALMQGGLLSRSSPHVFSSEKIERLVTHGKAGIKAGFKKLTFAFSLEFISPEFKGGLSHRWGCMEIGLKF